MAAGAVRAEIQETLPEQRRFERFRPFSGLQSDAARVDTQANLLDPGRQMAGADGETIVARRDRRHSRGGRQ
jgi:hypothetical protein